MSRRGERWNDEPVIPLSTLYAVVAVLLVALALVAFVAGELLVAGFFLLCTSFAIYLRETRT